MPLNHPDIDPLGRERRFLPSDEQVASFVRAVETGPDLAIDRTPRAPIFNRTTYLDTDELHYFRSCDGPVAKRLRIREYGTDGRTVPGPCYLELKQTFGTRRSKVRVAAQHETLVRLIEGATDLDPMWDSRHTQRVALRAIRDELEGRRFAARVGTWYRRRCLATSPTLRVTLDEDLTFFVPPALGELHRATLQPLAVGPARVLEIKYAGELPSWLGDAVKGLTEVSSFSKFRFGMLAVTDAANGATPDGPDISALTSRAIAKPASSAMSVSSGSAGRMM